MEIGVPFMPNLPRHGIKKRKKGNHDGRRAKVDHKRGNPRLVRKKTWMTEDVWIGGSSAWSGRDGTCEE
jgi:hypothetical protein